MRNFLPKLIAAAAAVLPLFAQSETEPVQALLKDDILPVQIAVMQFREYLRERVAPPPAPTDAKSWTAEQDRIRRHMLDDAVYHGWPREWVEAPPKFEETGIIAGKGYRIRKLRYEIVPGFYSAALLYEPEHPASPAPAILNVNGHVGPPGKSVEYKQKRCIQLAKNGVYALNVEWFGFGELAKPGNSHWYGMNLELAGRSGVGIFVLAMRKGIDYLYSLPGVDKKRIGMTGLSGGGWQTIVLSALDPRITATAPVAGFSSLASRIEVHFHGDVGDPEQSATDMFNGYDFTHLVGMLAPRAALLTYNAEDNCCFRGPVSKPLVFDAIKPIYEKYGASEALSWHENRDPGTHNYQLDNRQAVYRFFSRAFHVTIPEEETGVAEELKTYDELVVGLPADNLTLIDLARQAPREPGGGKERLTEIVRYRPVTLARAWNTGITKHDGVETKSFILQMDNRLNATAVWLKAISEPAGRPAIIVLDDRGKPSSAGLVSDRINRGDQVLAMDLAFMGEPWEKSDGPNFEQMLYGFGERPLGIEAAQLIAAARWLASYSGNRQVAVETTGFRSQVIALVAAALQPDLFRSVTSHDGIRSLGYLLEKPVNYKDAHDLFCRDLLKYFDIDSLTALSPAALVRSLNPR